MKKAGARIGRPDIQSAEGQATNAVLKMFTVFFRDSLHSFELPAAPGGVNV